MYSRCPTVDELVLEYYVHVSFSENVRQANDMGSSVGSLRHVLLHCVNFQFILVALQKKVIFRLISPKYTNHKPILPLSI